MTSTERTPNDTRGGMSSVVLDIECRPRPAVAAGTSESPTGRPKGATPWRMWSTRRCTRPSSGLTTTTWTSGSGVGGTSTTGTGWTPTGTGPVWALAVSTTEASTASKHPRPRGLGTSQPTTPTDVLSPSDAPHTRTGYDAP